MPNNSSINVTLASPEGVCNPPRGKAEGRAETVTGVWRFGPFVLDEHERSLVADGQAVELTGKSFETLLQLVRHSGRLLSRRELIDAVWPDAVVEEGNLHWTVSAVRKALTVHAPSVTYIETVRGFGYRFVQPVSADVPAAPRSVASESPSAALAPAAPAVAAPSVRPRARLAARATLVALLALLGALVVSHRGRVASPPGRRTLVVMAFHSLSGRVEDAWLATAVAEMLSANLAPSTELRAMSGEDVARMRRELGLPDASSVGRVELARIARHAGADWVVSGTYVVLPGADKRLRLDARVVAATSGDTVALASRAGRETELFELVGAVSDDLRAALGLRAVPVASGAQAALPSEPEARRAYAEGLERLRRLDARGAVPRLERAARLAPDFAGAASALSRAWLVLGDEERAEREALRAHQLAAGLPEPERLAIEANAHATARRWDAALAAWGRLMQLAPDEPEPALALAEAQLMAGRFQDALRTLEALRPRVVAGRDQARIEWLVSTAHAQMDDHAQALLHARQAQAIARREDAREIEVRALLREAFALPRAGGSLDEAIRKADEARRRAADLGDRNLLGKCLNFLGTLHSDAEDSAAAERLYRESLALHYELGAHTAIESVLFNLAVEATTRGDLRGAQGWHEQELQECRTTRSASCEARALTGLGDNRLSRGDLDEAERLLNDALARYRSLGNRNRQAEALASLAEVELWRGRPERAEPLFGEALALRQAAGSATAQVWARLDVVRLRLARADAAVPREDVESLAAAAQRSGRAEATLEGYARGLLARLELARGDLDAAAREAERAAQLVPLPRHPSTSFYVASTRTRVLLAQGKLDAAAAAIEAQQRAAQRAGFLAYELDARLLRARLAEAARHADEARTRLRELATEARAKGFGALVRAAESGSVSTVHR